MEDYCMPKRDAVPNMKLVMNPEGKKIDRIERLPDRHF